MFWKIFKIILLVAVVIFIILFSYFFIGFSKPAEKIDWGVNFSQRHSQNLGLDWKEVYSALLDDLKAKEIKIAVDWDMIEPEEGEYNFEDLDWQVQKAQEKGARLLLAIGLKTPRWPECHEPLWVKSQIPNSKSQNLLNYIREVVEKYKNSSAIWAWQVENEPFFPFGECPKFDKDLLKKEIDLVKSISSKPIIISDTGEFSFWFQAAKLADIVAVTMYRGAWFKELNSYISYPFTTFFYQRRAELVKKIFGKETICAELQAEPWGPRLLYDLSLEEQKKTMNLEKFKENIGFARKTGLKKFYLWGAEWWFWLKEKNSQPEIWLEAKKLF